MSNDRERQEMLDRILHSPSYRVAYKDVEFLNSPEMRAARIELEMLKPELALRAAQHPLDDRGLRQHADLEPAEAQKRLEAARLRLADTPDDPAAAARRCPGRADRRQEPLLRRGPRVRPAGLVRVPGGRQVRLRDRHRRRAGHHGGGQPRRFDVGAKSIGLNIRLPQEQQPNPYITPELCFQFHYFAIRKLHFLLRAKALVVFPGGFGTLDELFDALTLRQTGRMQDIPIIMFGREYWEQVINFQFLADEGTIDDHDLDLFRYAETPQEAWE